MGDDNQTSHDDDCSEEIIGDGDSFDNLSEEQSNDQDEDGEEETYPPAEIHFGFSHLSGNNGAIELDFDDDEIKEPTVDKNYADSDASGSEVFKKAPKQRVRKHRVRVLNRNDEPEEADFLMRTVKARVFEIGSSTEKEGAKTIQSNAGFRNDEDLEPLEQAIPKDPATEHLSQDQDNTMASKILKKTFPNK